MNQGHFTQDSLSSNGDLNRRLPNYEEAVIPLPPLRYVRLVNNMYKTIDKDKKRRESEFSQSVSNKLEGIYETRR
jgi:hypothetical protein